MIALRRSWMMNSELSISEVYCALARLWKKMVSMIRRLFGVELAG